MEENVSPTYKLYSPRQITVATFLGAPIAGAILLAANYRKLNQIGTAYRSVILGSILTIALLVLAFVLPEKFPNYILPAAYTAIMNWIVKGVQGAVQSVQHNTILPL